MDDVLPSISITTPAPGATVARTFTAAGAYTSQATPPITAELRDSNGTTVASAPGTLVGRGAWTAALVAPQAYTGASVYAEIVGTSANATAGGITVN